ncbi:ester cyclase [Pseudonocardia sp. GCM10023141]|uniref:ester cyclase n=1 Tax=Pseudonocardia sp. GCM10023141 TaxID=3252653 RepID=UPI00360708BD
MDGVGHGGVVRASSARLTPGVAMTGTEIVQRSADAWNNRDRDAYLACYAEDCEFTTPHSTGKGPAAVIAFWEMQMTAFPDNRVRVAALFDSGDLVAEEASFEGTQTGPGVNPDGTGFPPSGRSVTTMFAALHTVEGNVITRTAFYWDDMTFAAQLGLLPG